MAQKQAPLYFDDIDQTPEATPYRFMLGGVEYKIDLTTKHGRELAKLLTAIVPFVDAAICMNTNGALRRERADSGRREALLRNPDVVDLTPGGTPSTRVTTSPRVGTAQTSNRPKLTPGQSQAVREWAVATNKGVKPRGRVPGWAVEAYEAEVGPLPEV